MCDNVSWYAGAYAVDSFHDWRWSIAVRVLVVSFAEISKAIITIDKDLKYFSSVTFDFPAFHDECVSFDASLLAKASQVGG